MVQAHAEGDVGRQDDLVPGVDAFHVGGGVGLCVAQSLRFLQSLAVVQAQTGHGVENVVAGAVHDAAHHGDLLDAANALQLAQPADAAADSSGAAECHALFLGQGQQLVIESGDQRLVGSDNVLAGFDAGTDELISGVQTAHCFHHGVDGVIIQNFLEVAGDFCVGQGDVLQADHLGNLHVIALFGNIVHAAANDAKSQKTDIHNTYLRMLSSSAAQKLCMPLKNTCFFTENSIS